MLDKLVESLPPAVDAQSLQLGRKPGNSERSREPAPRTAGGKMIVCPTG
jgi:hypothetical protein